MRPYCPVILLATLLVCSPAAGQQAALNGDQAPTALMEVEKALEADREKSEALSLKAKELQSEMQAIRAKLVDGAHRAQELESELSRIEQTLTVLEVEEARARVNLRQRRQQMARIIQGLQRMALLPKESLLLGPGSPVDLARGNLVLQAALPRIEEEARDLRTDLSDLAVLRGQIETQKRDLLATEVALAKERDGLSQLLERKVALEAATGEELAASRAHAQALSQKAADLRDLIARLERERLLASITLPAIKPDVPPPPSPATTPASVTPPESSQTADGTAENMAPAVEEPAQTALLAPSAMPEDVRPFPDNPGSLVIPARGHLRYRFGAALPQSRAGGNAKGLYLETRPSAQVVAPYDGKVVYAQNFRGYGLILIIEHSGQYHSLLSGFERIDAIEGQWVLAGEPVGVMGDPGTGNPELYLELRRDGRPIDPLPWLAQEKEKVKS